MADINLAIKSGCPEIDQVCSATKGMNPPEGVESFLLFTLSSIIDKQLYVTLFDVGDDMANNTASGFAKADFDGIFVPISSMKLSGGGQNSLQYIESKLPAFAAALKKERDGVFSEKDPIKRADPLKKQLNSVLLTLAKNPSLNKIEKFLLLTYASILGKYLYLDLLDAGDDWAASNTNAQYKQNDQDAIFAPITTKQLSGGKKASIEGIHKKLELQFNRLSQAVKTTNGIYPKGKYEHDEFQATAALILVLLNRPEFCGADSKVVKFVEGNIKISGNNIGRGKGATDEQHETDFSEAYLGERYSHLKVELDGAAGIKNDLASASIQIEGSYRLAKRTNFTERGNIKVNLQGTIDGNLDKHKYLRLTLEPAGYVLDNRKPYRTQGLMAPHARTNAFYSGASLTFNPDSESFWIRAGYEFLHNSITHFSTYGFPFSDKTNQHAFVGKVQGDIGSIWGDPGLLKPGFSLRYSKEKVSLPWRVYSGGALFASGEQQAWFTELDLLAELGIDTKAGIFTPYYGHSEIQLLNDPDKIYEDKGGVRWDEPWKNIFSLDIFGTTTFDYKNKQTERYLGIGATIKFGGSKTWGGQSAAVAPEPKPEVKKPAAAAKPVQVKPAPANTAKTNGVTLVKFDPAKKPTFVYGLITESLITLADGSMTIKFEHGTEPQKNWGGWGMDISTPMDLSSVKGVKFNNVPAVGTEGSKFEIRLTDKDGTVYSCPLLNKNEEIFLYKDDLSYDKNATEYNKTDGKKPNADNEFNWKEVVGVVFHYGGNAMTHTIGNITAE